MIDISGGEWDGLEGMAEEVIRELKPNAMRLVEEGLVRMTNAVKETLTGARSGEPYKVSKTGSLHIASAPMEPPAELTGALRNSVFYRGPRWVDNGAEGDVGPGIATPKPKRSIGRTPTFEEVRSYAVFLEYGTYKMDPRPYMEPTVQKMAPRLERLFGGL